MKFLEMAVFEIRRFRLSRLYFWYQDNTVVTDGQEKSKKRLMEKLKEIRRHKEKTLMPKKVNTFIIIRCRWIKFYKIQIPKRKRPTHRI